MLEEEIQGFVNENILVLLADIKGIVIKCNNSFLPIHIGDSIYELHPFFQCFTSVVDSNNTETTFNCVHLDNEGSDFIVDIRMKKKEDGVLITLNNFTQHYNEYQIVAQARNESVIETELTVLKNIELEKRELFKNEFIQNFSHELRNPLTNSISIANLLEGTKITNEQRKMLEYLRDSHLHLKLLLEDTLSISMIAAGKMALRESDFNLLRSLELLEFTYGNKAKLKNLDFGAKFDKKLPEHVRGDRLRIYQVLSNLLENAVKYSDEGSVSFEVELNQKWGNKANVRFKISDSGCGIEKDDFPKIFDSFSRLNVNDGRSGVGLGLPVVKGLLELMGSELQVVSTPGKGSEFFFDINLNFPLNLTSALGSNGKTRIKGFAENKTDSTKYRMLIVEDNEQLQTILLKMLIEEGHFYIDLVNDGSRVIEQVINNQYDIILMDVNLPNANGDELTKLLREFPFKNFKNIPIIGITANAYKEAIDTFLAKGMNAVLTKPFEKDLLLKTIFKFLK